MTRSIRLFLLGFLVCIVPSATWAGYLYESKCPDGDIPPGKTIPFPGGDINGGYWVASSGFWADQWSFGQCECTSYVTWRINEALASMRLTPNFSNSAFGQRWSNAGNWKSVAQGLNIPIFTYPCPGCVGFFPASTKPPVGHVVFVESVRWKSGCLPTNDDWNQCVEDIKISDYNGKGTHEYRAPFTVKPGDSNYPKEYLPILDMIVDCQEMFGSNLASCSTSKVAANLTPGGFGGGTEEGGTMPVTGGTSSSSLPDIIPYERWMTNTPDTLSDRSNTSTICRPGEQRWMKGRTKNIGSRDSPSGISVGFYCSEGEKVDSNPVLCGSDEVKKDNLKVGKTNTETESIYCPEYPGKYNWVFCPDNKKQVAEKDERNCSSEWVYSVLTNPDVTLGNLYLGNGVNVFAPGATTSATVTAFNVGETFGKTIRIGYYLVDEEAETFLGYDSIKRENLKGGQSKVESLSTFTVPTTPGWYRLVARINYDRRITETRYDNNEAVIYFQVQ